MGDWLGPRRRHPRLQEVRAPTRRPGAARRGLGHPARRPRPRAAPVWPSPPAPSRSTASARRDDFDTAGRWLEADYDSALGDASPHRRERLRALRRGRHPEAGREVQVPRRDVNRLPELATHSELALVVGDLNVGHRTRHQELEGQRQTCRLPAGGARLLRPLPRRGNSAGWMSQWPGGRVDGPYTWWSQRGQAFDNDTGWRIDYQLATPASPRRSAPLSTGRDLGHPLVRPRPGGRRLRL